MAKTRAIKSESHARIIPLMTIERSTPIYAKKMSDVTTLQRNEPIVEKKRSFPMITDFLSPCTNSESSGIVWLARKTGKIKSRDIPIQIGRKYPIPSPRRNERSVFSKGKLTKV